MKGILVFCLCLLAVPVAANPQSATATVRLIPGVINAMTDNGGNMFVFVQNNPQGQWNTAAEKICKIVRPHQARIFLVKMIDAASVNQKNKPKDWSMLGGANCGSVK